MIMMIMSDGRDRRFFFALNKLVDQAGSVYVQIYIHIYICVHLYIYKYISLMSFDICKCNVQ